jgi:hypothetical protein
MAQTISSKDWTVSRAVAEILLLWARTVSALAATLKGVISTGYPASILRRHAAAKLYLDGDSAAEI